MGQGTKKKRTIIEETVPDSSGGFSVNDPNEPSEFDVSLESVEDAEALSDVLTQFGETHVNLKVLRQSPSGSEFCYQTDTLDEEFIQKNFGGGDYQVRIFINGRYRKTIKIKIASRILLDHHVHGPSPNAGYPNDRHSEFLEKMVLALVANQNQSGNQSSVGELATAMKELYTLKGDSDKESKAMDLFLKGVDFAKDLTGQTDWKTDLIKTAKEVLPGITEAITGNRNPSNPPLAAIPPDAMIRAGIAFLKKKAIGGMDPNLVIDWIAANADDPQYQVLIHAVLTTEFADFAKLDPEIGTEPFIQWFKPLFDGLRSTFKPVDTVDVDSRGDVGDDHHSGNHGEPSAGGSKKPKGK